MRFFVLTDDSSSTIGAHPSLSAAVAQADSYMPHESDDTWEITSFDVDINAETVRRLLGNMGGYARNIRNYEVRRDSAGKARATPFAGDA